MRANFICRIKGHETNEFDAYTCGRCDATCDGSPAWNGSIWWRMTWRLRAFFGLPPFGGYTPLRKRITRWFAPCEECGRRFGRHDDSVDHIPF